MSEPALLLVRHAVAVARSRWDGDDGDRPLTDRGAAQAEGLVELLSGFDLSVVLSSPSLRCVRTVALLAEARGLPVSAAPALAEGRAAVACELVASLAGAAAVLCTHGDVVPVVLDDLARRDGLDLGRKRRWAKGSTWALWSDAGRYVKAEYLPPPA